ncbi:MAG: lauroyl acyltransferase [Rhodospirillales bacterium]|nr:lauroyl acyltransferase [Rhodospirillales bacterium]
MRKFLRRYLGYPLEGLGAALLYGLLTILPTDAASALGGWFGRSFGPWIPLSNRARGNLRAAFPEKGPAEIEALVKAMWDNLGRTIGEYPHLDDIDFSGADGRIVYHGLEHVDALRDDGQPGIFFAAHLANWEICSCITTERGLPLMRIYRAANNPLVEWIFRAGRKNILGKLVPKGADGGRQLIAEMREGGHIGLLVDQKMNDGIPVPFFGRPAMTAAALARLAIRFGCPLVGCQMVRKKGARFEAFFTPPFTFPTTGDTEADLLAAMTEVNRIIEGWVRQNPAQWLWLHRRWPD